MSVARNLTLLTGLLLGAPAFARVQYCAQLLAPADGQTLPANARAVVAHGREVTRPAEDGGTETWRPWIRRLDADGGIQFLETAAAELQPASGYGDATLFLPGALTPGERIQLESSPDCTWPLQPAAEVLVVEAAPVPQQIGEPASPPSIRVEPGPDQLRGPSEPLAKRDVYLDFDPSVGPWLGVARVNLEVNGQPRSTAFGSLTRGYDGGSRVFVGELTRPCSALLTREPENTLVTWLVRLELELPGVTERPPAVEFEADMDCRQSCASVGAIPLLAGILLLLARRRGRPLDHTQSVGRAVDVACTEA